MSHIPCDVQGERTAKLMEALAVAACIDWRSKGAADTTNTEEWDVATSLLPSVLPNHVESFWGMF